MQTLDAFDRAFPTDEACKTYLAKKRWPDGVRCPRCGAKEKVYALKEYWFDWKTYNPATGLYTAGPGAQTPGVTPATPEAPGE